MPFKLIAALALLSSAWAQQPPPSSANPILPRYQANKTTVLSGTAEKITVQATANSGAVSFEEADVYCSVACVATIQVAGTAATTTTLAVTGPMGVVSAIPPAAFSTSNVGTGTTLKSFNIAAGATLVLDMHAFYLPPAAGGFANLSIGVAAITGTVTIQIQWVNQ
jgi:hypothetical protein